jgi:N-acetylneuraminic acid mutarotase
MPDPTDRAAEDVAAYVGDLRDRLRRLERVVTGTADEPPPGNLAEIRDGGAIKTASRTHLDFGDGLATSVSGVDPATTTVSSGAATRLLAAGTSSVSAGAETTVATGVSLSDTGTDAVVPVVSPAAAPSSGDLETMQAETVSGGGGLRYSAVLTSGEAWEIDIRNDSGSSRTVVWALLRVPVDVTIQRSLDGWGQDIALNKTFGYEQIVATDDRVFGFAQLNSETPRVQAYDLNAGSLTTPPQFPVTNEDDVGVYSAFNTDTDLWAIGSDGDTSTINVYRFDLAADTWSIETQVPGDRTSVAATSVGGTLVVAGGSEPGTGVVDTVDRYDVGTGSWSTGSALPFAVEATNAVALDGQMYVIGGFDASANARDTLQRYDVAADSWTTLSPHPSTIRESGNAAVDGSVYTINGTDGSFSPIRTVYEYDVQSDSWTDLSLTPLYVDEQAADSNSSSIWTIGVDSNDDFRRRLYEGVLSS